jgi:hypothetical protein
MPGDRFGPGDTITGEWQTTQNVVSPSFKLCAGGEDGCGATVWPEVVESAGYYHVSLCVRGCPSSSHPFLPAFLLTKMKYGYTSQTELPNLPVEKFQDRSECNYGVWVLPPDEGRLWRQVHLTGIQSYA